MNYSDDEKIALGEFCAHVLSSDAFTAVTKTFEESTVQALLSTKATETKRRDELYFNLSGVRDFMRLMQDLVNERDRLILGNPTHKPSDDDEHIGIYDAEEHDDEDV